MKPTFSGRNLALLFGGFLYCLPLMPIFLEAAEPMAGAAAAVIPFEEWKSTEPVLFDKHVFPILAEKCISCHDAEGGLAEGGLDLLTVAAIHKGGKRGPSFMPGKGAESLLVKLAAKAAKPFMPPKNETPLTSRELTVLKVWIDQGAKTGSQLKPAEAMRQKVELGTLPPGVHPVYSLDMNAAGTMLAAGRANDVFVYDIPSGGTRAQLKGHEDLVQSVKLSGDGQWLAAGGYQNVKLWRVPQETRIANLAGHNATIKSLAVSPDGKIVASAADDNTVRLWDLAAAKALGQPLAHPGAVHAVTFSHDGKWLITGCADRNVRVFQAADGKLAHALAGAQNQVLAVAISADGKWLAAGGMDNMVRVWDFALVLAPPAPPPPPDKKPADKNPPPKAPAKEPVKEPVKDRPFPGHGGAVRQVAFAAGALISTADDGTLRVWNLADGKQLRAIGHGSPIVSLAVSPDGKWAATGGNDKLVKTWNLADGAAQRVLNVHTHPVLALAVSRDGKRLATAGADNLLFVWDAARGRLLHSYQGHTGAIHALTFAADSKIVVSGSVDKSLGIWGSTGEWTNPQTLGPFQDRVTALDFSPDHKLLAIGGGLPAAAGELIIWDLAKQAPLRTFKDVHSDVVYGVAFSADGKWIASGSADKFVKVHEVATGNKVKSFEGHTHHVLGVCWKPDSKQLVSAAADNSLKQWSMETGEQIRTVGGHSRQVTGVVWVPKTNFFASSCADRQVRMVNSDNGGVIRGFGGANDFFFCVAASAENKIVAGGGQEGKIFVWNGQNSQLLRTLEVPPADTQVAR